MGDPATTFTFEDSDDLSIDLEEYSPDCSSEDCEEMMSLAEATVIKWLDTHGERLMNQWVSAKNKEEAVRLSLLSQKKVPLKKEESFYRKQRQELTSSQR